VFECVCVCVCVCVANIMRNASCWPACVCRPDVAVLRVVRQSYVVLWHVFAHIQ
jgi:hypothetical protein